MPNSLPPETLAWLRHAASCGQRDAQLTLHTLERLEAMEKKNEIQRLATLEWGKDVDKLERWIDVHLKRTMALEAAQQQQPHQDKLDRHLLGIDDPTPEAAPVATPESGEVAELVASLRNRDRWTQLTDAQVDRAATLLQQLSTPAPPATLSDALIKAECALSDIAEGEETNAAPNTFEWAEQRCAEALDTIRPVMRDHGICTSEWPPDPQLAPPVVAIRAALERLVKLRNTDTHALLGSDWHEAFVAARVALAQPEAEGQCPK